MTSKSKNTDQTAVHIVGLGLAGCEAAFFLAERGVNVICHEMKSKKMTPAQHSKNWAELVCSNSFKSKRPESAPGMLKAELKTVGSLIYQCALKSEVPGGEALVIDRDVFSALVTDAIRKHPRIQIVEEEIEKPDLTFVPGPAVGGASAGSTTTTTTSVSTSAGGASNSIWGIATGPLTSDALGQWVASACGQGQLYFYDAIAPVVDATTIDRDIVFAANRYDKGEEVAYLNCPMNKEQYTAFIEALNKAEKVPSKNFEKEIFYQGCQPIEAMAATGFDTLRYGPMKPVGLSDPRQQTPEKQSEKDSKWGGRPYAVVQLRPENKSLTAYNLVGFQTKLKYGEQSRIFRMIPGLEKAEFFRLGSVHRNTFVKAPECLRPDFTMKSYPNVYLGGQITGVEGYLESTAAGFMMGLFMYQRLKGLTFSVPPSTSAMGALHRHVMGGADGGGLKDYQPSGIQFGLMEPIFYSEQVAKAPDKRVQMAEEGIRDFEKWWREER